ncbi:Maf family protein [Pseudoalteromonas piratica]|uniref:dTTP/UTP pyrophosphatase n=1 Tax=Pseudoalteromonas piratica TaxID=1348114 RepID=A0A0A7EDC2_9GAMM|nr:Maf family protein [Pseudoalteromonas piratica]AIY64538.1 septum formation inhibitor Maf [Pseudoalteromonas piratica]
MSTKIYLASASPRRKQLLSQLDVAFEQFATDIDESQVEGETAEAFVSRLAEEKALAGVEIAEQDYPVLGSDTIVVLNGQVLGKPTDQSDAIATLTALSGQTHQVMTAIAFANKSKVKSMLVTTEVTFKHLSQQEINDYCATKEPLDKAGSYGIQGGAGRFVTNLNGSYFAVMGLPLYETEKLLNEFIAEGV